MVLIGEDNQTKRGKKRRGRIQRFIMLISDGTDVEVDNDNAKGNRKHSS